MCENLSNSKEQKNTKGNLTEPEEFYHLEISKKETD